MQHLSGSNWTSEARRDSIYSVRSYTTCRVLQPQQSLGNQSKSVSELQAKNSATISIIQPFLFPRVDMKWISRDLCFAIVLVCFFFLSLFCFFVISLNPRAKLLFCYVLFLFFFKKKRIQQINFFCYFFVPSGCVAPGNLAIRTRLQLRELTVHSRTLRPRV